MTVRHAIIGLVLGTALAGQVPVAGADGAGGIDDDPDAAADTVYTARIGPLNVVAERPAQEGASTDARTAGEHTQREQNTAQRRHAGASSGSQAERDVTTGGFVMNETFSVIGNDFYSAFYGAWSEPEEAGLYTVYVREKPSPQFGARLSVEVDDTQIFRTFLRPNNRKIRQAAQQAAERAQVYVTEYHEPREVY